MAALVGINQLALLEWVEQHVTLVMLSLPQGGDEVSTEARRALEPLHLEPVMEVSSCAQRLVVVANECLEHGAVHTMIAVLHDYEWQALTGSKSQPKAARWFRLVAKLLPQWTHGMVPAKFAQHCLRTP